MKKFITYSLFLSFFFYGASQDVNIGETTKPGHTLIIKLRQLEGNIKIQGWNKNTVQIKGDIDTGEDYPMRLKKTTDGFRLQIKNSDKDYDDDENIDTDLVINVPFKYNLKISTQTEFEMSNVEGKFDINIANEDAEFDNIKGQGEISVANGHLNIDNSTFDGSLYAVNGNLIVKKTDVYGKATTVNGFMNLSSAPKGIDLSSTNGNISIESVNNYIDASTVNGNLEIGSLNGRLEFGSTNGSVKASLKGDSKTGNHSVNIKTLNGSVTLTLPSDFSMDFDMIIRESNGRNRGDYMITSDFNEIQIRKEDDDRDHKVNGKGKIGNGKNKAKMRIINGNITLKKE